jgi:hypothetical protein
MWGVRFTSRQRVQIETFAKTHGLARAEAIRILVDKGLT